MRSSPAFPFVAPFVVFMVLLTLAGFGPIEARIPHHWLYPIRSVITLGVIVWVWRRLPPLRFRSVTGSVGVGLLVCVLWVVLDPWLPWLELGGKWLSWERTGGYNPFDPAEALSESTAWGFVVVRILAGAFVVAISEEMFWRGWLQRWLIEPDFEKVAVGTYERRSFWMTTGAFALVHPQVFTAVIVGAIYGWWLIRTRNVWDVVLAHAVTNLVLYAWVVWSGRFAGRAVWYFWP